MLSNPSSSLQQRQRQHRRQNSTPDVFNAPKVALLPANALQRNGSHRRGQSLDHGSPATQRSRRQSTQQDTRTVSTNPGSPQRQQQQQQQVLREAQQQRLARPGQPPKEFINLHPAQPFGDAPQDYINKCFNTNSFTTNNAQDNSNTNNNGNNTHLTNSPTHISDNNDRSYGKPPTRYDLHSFLQEQDSNLAAGYLDGFGLGLEQGAAAMNGAFRGNGDGTVRASKRNSRSYQGQDVTQWAQAGPARNPQQHPITPPNQKASLNYPITPENTPFRRIPQTEPCHRVGLNLSPSSKVDANETIKASRSRGSPTRGSFQDIFEDPRNHDHQALPSPPYTAPLGHGPSGMFDVAQMPDPSFMSMTSLNMNLMGNEGGYESSYHSPVSVALSPSQSSFLSSPEMEHLQLYENPMQTMPDLAAIPERSMMLPSAQSSADLIGDGSPMKGRMPARSMSMADLNLDASIEDTGITVDDISNFIHGPEASDGKWVCLFPECKKRFGRKENIKSHVQTHLGDRQYRCNHCKKCFVRQHDLKRHAKIHSGVKPYPCLCGNSFARHDALTRHRQRGMCVGAFEGIVKKVVKRGRPRKERPEGEDRRLRRTNTRRQHQAIAMSTSSSMSGMSEHSQQSQYNSPPAGNDEDNREFSSRGVSPLDMLTRGLHGGQQQLAPQHSQEQAQSQTTMDEVFHYTPPMSPRQTGLENFCVSPQHIQHSPTASVHSLAASMKREQSNASHRALEEAPTLPSHPTSPERQSASQFNTPPELCLGSSSPAPTSHFFEMDKLTATNLTSTAPSSLANHEDESAKKRSFGDEVDFDSLPGIDEHINDDEDMFLDFSAGSSSMGMGMGIGSLSTLEKHPDLLLLDDRFGDDFNADGGEDMLF